MSGIVGISRKDSSTQVMRMLDKLTYRGKGKPFIVEGSYATLGMISSIPELYKGSSYYLKAAVWDGLNPPLPFEESLKQSRGGFTLAVADKQDFFLARDQIGICPLYFGITRDGSICFASEVKPLLELTKSVREFPPGNWMDSQGHLNCYYELHRESPLDLTEEVLAVRLKFLIEQAVLCRLRDPHAGCWLSGGLDSSGIAAFARKYLYTLHTFVGGLDGSPDMQHAAEVAHFLDTKHHEVIVTKSCLLKALPTVIYHLESFDALLVRSSVVNFLVGETAAFYVNTVFSGEGGDELFGGYEYLKDLSQENLDDELIDITRRLHNTALQRVDRSASAHGLTVFVPLLDMDVVEFALRIPNTMKIKRNGKAVEKYIFRRALRELLPENILSRPKSKFWQGSGVGTLLEQHAEETITDTDFSREHILRNGWHLNTKEELMYYRIFKGHFGNLEDLEWMGRTKNAPKV